MASSDHLTRLKNIRDNFEKELEDESARRIALTAAGNPPPTTYSSGGKNLSWNEYVSTMRETLKELNQQIIDAGADGGLIESYVQGYV